MLNRHMLGLLLLVLSLGASAEEAKLKDVDIPINPATFRAGAQTVTTVCVACHSLKYIKYRHLLDIGFTTQEVDAIRGDKTMNDFIDRLSPAEDLKASFGKVPPDLSLMAKARRGGGEYIYSLLTGFYTKPDGTPDNHVFPGVRMPDPLNYASAQDDKERKQIETQAVEVSSFLTWAADPHQLRRKSIGYWVIGYFILYTVLMFLMKKRIWRKLK